MKTLDDIFPSMTPPIWRFINIWNRLERRALCDGIEGIQYHRIRALWSESMTDQETEQLIICEANTPINGDNYND